MEALALEGELTIYTAAGLKATVLELISAQDAPELDLSGITELDTAGLQLLILAKREAAHAGKTLRLTQHSQAVLDVLELTRLTPVFGDPVVLRPRTGDPR